MKKSKGKLNHEENAFFVFDGVAERQRFDELLASFCDLRMIHFDLKTTHPDFS